MTSNSSITWTQPLREALDNVQKEPVERVAALRAQFASLQEELPRGALKVQERAADQLERQIRRNRLKAIGDEVCALLIEFGLRARIESVAQRRSRKSLAKQAPASTTQGSLPPQASAGPGVPEPE